MTPLIWARDALMPEGWRERVAVAIGSDGRIASVTADAHPGGAQVDVLLPAPANLHGHAFQRAMAARAERRGCAGRDNFWSWRESMYALADRITPPQLEAVAAMAQMEMLESGFGASVEFQYLHHGPGGLPYASPAEMSERILAAAEISGIGLALLPVLYAQGGCDGRPAAGAQLRFASSLDGYARCLDDLGKSLRGASEGSVLGVAPHSLRAVPPAWIGEAAALLPGAPVHLHVAEQAGEVEEVLAVHGERPLKFLLDRFPVADNWCMVHCTRSEKDELARLQQTGATLGLCPETEANLGDGVFDAAGHLASGGRIGVGTDSNIRISLAGELRLLEYGQRLRDRTRARLAPDGMSVGRSLFEACVEGGAKASGRAPGGIRPGSFADLLSLAGNSEWIASCRGDMLLDALVFGSGERAIDQVWSAGRLRVQDGRHVHRRQIVDAYRATMRQLWE